MSGRYEALAKALSDSRVVQSRFSPRPKFVQPSLDESERIAAAVVDFVTSDESVDRVAAVLKEQYGEFVASAWRINARAALLAAVGGV